MSLPSPEQNQNKQHSEREPEYGDGRDHPQDAFTEAETVQGTPVSIIPVAPIHWRLLAAFLDWTLIGLFAFLLLVKVLVPQYHPVGYTQWTQLRSEQNAEIKAALENGEPLPPLVDMQWVERAQTEEIQAMFIYGFEIFGLCVLIYFILCERFMAGGSIGKSMLRLRVISLNSGRPPRIWESALRALIKICPLISPLFVISYFFLFFNRLRRTGHDLLARTLVVSDTGGYVPHVQPRKRRDEDDDDED